MTGFYPPREYLSQSSSRIPARATNGGPGLYCSRRLLWPFLHRSMAPPPEQRQEVVPAGPPTVVAQDMGVAGQLPAAVLWNVASRIAPEWRGVLKHVCRDFRAAVARSEQEQGSRSVIFMQVRVRLALHSFCLPSTTPYPL